MKFLKNKFFIIALSVAIFAVIFTATLSLMGVTDPFKDLINTASVPLRYAGVAVKDSIDGFKKYFTAIDRLDAENKDLKDRRLEEKYNHWNKSLDEYLKTIETAKR